MRYSGSLRLRGFVTNFIASIPESSDWSSTRGRWCLTGASGGTSGTWLMVPVAVTSVATALFVEDA
jgi:hypothetical protein